MLGYTFRYQLFVYSYNSCLYLHTCCFRLSFSCLFIMLFIYLISAVILVIILCTLFICMSSPLSTHTHQVAFWRPWNCTSRYWTLCFYDSGVRWDCSRSFAKSWSFSLFDSGILIFLAFILFPDSRYIRFSCYSSSLFIWYHAWMLICDITIIMIYYS